MRPIIPTVLAMFVLEHASAGPPKFDLAKEKVLYCVGYAHLDTQWRWDYCTTIDKYIRSTLEDNFARFEKYPGYVFNFTGSVRYEMMKEYYPEQYKKLKDYIAQGRWFVSGSSVDEGDVNVPSAEAIIRQVLYGNDFFRREFDKESVDFMLPDCFGFPASLPSIWAHCGLKGFSTQKLTWGSAVGIPFKIGVWEGSDGKSVLAAFDPGPYVGAIKGRVDLNKEWVSRVLDNGQKYGVFADYHYYGVGDQGGAPREEDIQNYLASIDNPDSQIKVALVSSDQMFRDITPQLEARLPRYKGDLLLTEHSAGTLTSQSYMKRWNRKGELLADCAERAAVAAHWLGGAKYPREELNRSWVRLLANQMHDILPGTSIPRAYTFSWNDEIVAMNGFAAVTENSVEAIARELDTQVTGIPLVVYNPLAISREDPVEATVVFKQAPSHVQVYDSAGRPVPTQILEAMGNKLRILFLATTPALSWSVFDVRPSEPDHTIPTLSISETELVNEHYRVSIDANGDISSIMDKSLNRELLSAPARLVFTHEKPLQWPAWNMDWNDRQKPPVDALSGPAKIRIVERGPVRVALEIERETRNSVVRQVIRLAGGDAGKRIEVINDIDWQSAECALKASFPLTASNPKATYNWGLGTIQRGNNEPTKYEVPSHEWFDLTDTSGSFGVTVLDDSKYGSDKPSDNELRLTLLYTPGVRSGYLDQHSQDWGRHEIVYGLYGHAGDWRQGGSEWQGRRLNQPLRVWQAEAHPGRLGKELALATISTQQVDIRAVKLAEHSDRVIVRVQELWGQSAQGVELAFSKPIESAEETDGQERVLGSANLKDGKLIFDLTPFAPKTFALRLAKATVSSTTLSSQTVVLPFNIDVISSDNSFDDGAFDPSGRTIPAEMLPASIVSGGIQFELGLSGSGKMNAVSCSEQEIALPAGFDRLHILAAADEDASAPLTLGDAAHEWSVQSWTGFVGQWDDRTWDRDFDEVDFVCEGRVTGFKPAYIKRDPIAWFCTHRHHPRRGNEPYRFSYLFKYEFPLAARDTMLRLPDDPRIKVLAMTLSKGDGGDLRLASPLYDDFNRRKPVELRHTYPAELVAVHKGLEPSASIVLDRRASFSELRMGPPSATDYIDAASGRGIAFHFFEADGNYRPHPRAGADGDRLPRLNDGQAAENSDDTKRTTWWDGEGRFFVDLKESLTIARVKTYSWHRADRARQFFSLWGANGEALPNAGFQHGEHGPWVLLAVVDSRELGSGGVHGSSVEPAAGQPSLGSYRYLLWVTPTGTGTFFTEVDVDVAD